MSSQIDFSKILINNFLSIEYNLKFHKYALYLKLNNYKFTNPINNILKPF